MIISRATKYRGHIKDVKSSVFGYFLLVSVVLLRIARFIKQSDFAAAY